MKKEYILLNLTEAKDSIDELIREIDENNEYEFGNYLVDMQHIYWHINKAWNGRDFDFLNDKLSDEQEEKFIQFPNDLLL